MSRIRSVAPAVLTLPGALGFGRIIARATVRSAAMGMVIDGVSGTIEAGLAWRKGADADVCKRHVVRKVAAGAVVGAAGGLAGMGAVAAFGPGIAAIVVGTLAASGASKLYRQVSGPMPLDGFSPPKARRSARKAPARSSPARRGAPRRRSRA